MKKFLRYFQKSKSLVRNNSKITFQAFSIKIKEMGGHRTDIPNYYIISCRNGVHNFYRLDLVRVIQEE
jgi:hypothetical protein